MRTSETRLNRIDHQQRLYVLRCGAGYTCLGFDVCETRKRRLAAELCAELNGNRPGTKAAYTEYRGLLALAVKRHDRTGWRSDSELTPQLKGLEGWRVEVVTRRGEGKRFIVGRSTGAVPCHLELKRRDSTGGPVVIGAPFRSVRRLQRVR